MDLDYTFILTFSLSGRRSGTLTRPVRERAGVRVHRNRNFSPRGEISGDTVHITFTVKNVLDMSKSIIVQTSAGASTTIRSVSMEKLEQ